jgi:hypothetical protein
MWIIISAVLGIAGTLLAWFLNPKRRMYAELDGIYQRLEELYRQRDKALVNKDSDTLTIVTNLIVNAMVRKNTLLKRI